MALRQDRNGGVIAVQALSRQNMAWTSERTVTSALDSTLYMLSDLLIGGSEAPHYAAPHYTALLAELCKSASSARRALPRARIDLRGR